MAHFMGRGSLPPPLPAQWSGGRVPAARQGGGRLPPGASAQKQFIFVYI